MAVKPEAIAHRAQTHLGESGKENTCVSNGMGKWPAELGLAVLDTASVSTARALARDGAEGWRYVEGTAGIRVGYFVDWKDYGHVSVVDAIDWRGHIRSIGSGGPTGKVAYQPKGGGFNPPSTFRGYFIPPTSTKRKPPALTYVVRPGETLAKIAAAHGTTWQKLAAANGIPDPDHIEAGWRLKLR